MGPRQKAVNSAKAGAIGANNHPAFQREQWRTNLQFTTNVRALDHLFARPSDAGKVMTNPTAVNASATPTLSDLSAKATALSPVSLIDSPAFPPVVGGAARPHMSTTLSLGKRRRSSDCGDDHESDDETNTSPEYLGRTSRAYNSKPCEHLQEVDAEDTEEPLAKKPKRSQVTSNKTSGRRGGNHNHSDDIVYLYTKPVEKNLVGSNKLTHAIHTVQSSRVRNDGTDLVLQPRTSLADDSDETSHLQIENPAHITRDAYPSGHVSPCGGTPKSPTTSLGSSYTNPVEVKVRQLKSEVQDSEDIISQKKMEVALLSKVHGPHHQPFEEPSQTHASEVKVKQLESEVQDLEDIITQKKTMIALLSKVHRPRRRLADALSSIPKTRETPRQPRITAGYDRSAPLLGIEGSMIAAMESRGEGQITLRGERPWSLSDLE
ncbi:hypothetical protein GGR57DRAFT_503963 [Xylariaceae sp. FL1272]|nr:hypothetical protein GGR57DRAFT_503963 [Xylariaceae sp. FL1272]